MFSLSNLFAAFKRLTNAVNQTACLFETANTDLKNRLTIRDGEPATNGNGHVKRITKAKTKAQPQPAFDVDRATDLVREAS